MSDYPNLYADLSAGSGYNALTRDEEFTAGFFERHRKQIVFATDCPCTDGRGGNFNGLCFSPRLKALLRRTIRDEAALDDVFYNNAVCALKGTS